jgi:hypothetical protein
MGPQSNSRLLAFPANIRLRQKQMADSNTTSYYNKATITKIKSFIALLLEAFGTNETTPKVVETIQ